MNKGDRTRRLRTALIAVATVAASATGAAQSFPYTLTIASEPYEPVAAFDAELGSEQLTTRVLVGDGASIPTFHFVGFRMDTIRIYPRGAVALMSEGLGWTGQLSALASDWVPRSVPNPDDHSSRLGIVVEGTEGSRILKVEWRNLTLAADTPGDGLDSINYQLWLHEGTDAIEVRVGPSAVASPFRDFETPVSGPSLGMIQPPSESIPEPAGIYFTGSPDAVARHEWSLGMSFGYLRGFPADGTVYRFTPATTRVSDDGRGAGTVAAFPNPTRERTTVAFALTAPAHCSLRLHDALGVERVSLVLGRLSAGEHRTSLTTSTLPAGLYFYTLSTGDRLQTRPLVIR